MTTLLSEASQAQSEAAKAQAFEERRRSRRDAFVAAAWLSNEAGNRNSTQQQVQVFDLSLQGVGFTSEFPLETGAVHWIVVGNGALRVSSRVRITNCRPAANMKFDCGGEFF
jgi:hypothetical protein